MNTNFNKSKAELTDNAIIYLNILHFAMSFSIVGFFLLIVVLFFGVNVKNSLATPEILIFFTGVNLFIHPLGIILFYRSPKRIANLYSGSGNYDEGFYTNLVSIAVSMIIMRNLLLIFPSLFALVTFYISIAGGVINFSIYFLNILFPILNLSLLFKNRPSRQYLRENFFCWF